MLGKANDVDAMNSVAFDRVSYSKPFVCDFRNF